MANSTYYGTTGNDTLDASSLSEEYTTIDLLAGDDTVYLGTNQTFVSGPGDDTVVGNGQSQYALWYANEPVYVNLQEGYASDGFGGTDTLSGINTVHMTGLGGTVIGASNDEKVFCFGGDSYIDLGEGNDTVEMYNINSSDYNVQYRDGTWYLQGDDNLVEIHNTEKVIFKDKTYITDLIPYTRHEPYIFDAKTGTGNAWFERVDLNQDGLMDIIYYANSTRSWSTNFDISPEAYLQVLIQQPDGSLINKTNELITNNISPIMGNNLSLGDFNGDGILDFVLAGSGWDPYSNGKPAGNSVDAQYGEPDIFYLSQPNGTWNCSTPTDRNVWSHSITIGDINLDGLDDAFSSSILNGGQNPDPGRSFFSMGDKEGNLTADQLTLPSWLSGQSRNEHYVRPDGQEFISEDVYTGSLLFDANGDHAADLLVLPGVSGKTSLLLLNNGYGDFSESKAIELPYGPYGPGGYSKDWMIKKGSVMLEAVSLDIDQDGDNDIVTLSTDENSVNGDYNEFYSGSTLQVLLNDSAGNFTVSQTIELVPESAGNYNYHYDINVYDVNRDGFADIVATSKAPDGYYQTDILLNQKGTLEVATDSIIPNKINNFIPLHVDGKLGFIEFFDTGYGNDPRDDAGLATTTFTLMTNEDYEVGHTIAGGTAAEQLIGSSSNDTFIWSGGSDVFNGLDGIDTLKVPGTLSQIDIDGSSLTYGYETVQMTSIERIQANDSSLALDLTGNAGMTAKLLGVTFGPESINNKEYVGIGLYNLDLGMHYEDLATLAIGATGAVSNEDIVSTLWENLFGSLPSTEEAKPYIDMLYNGDITPGNLTVLAADLQLNEENIGLTGLMQSGIEYIPYDGFVV